MAARDPALPAPPPFPALLTRGRLGADGEDVPAGRQFLRLKLSSGAPAVQRGKVQPLSRALRRISVGMVAGKCRALCRAVFNMLCAPLHLQGSAHWAANLLRAPRALHAENRLLVAEKVDANGAVGIKAEQSGVVRGAVAVAAGLRGMGGAGAAWAF